MTEDEMVGWHHRLDGHEFEQAPEVGDGQGGLACCSPQGWKDLWVGGGHGNPLQYSCLESECILIPISKCISGNSSPCPSPTSMTLFLFCSVQFSLVFLQ